MPFNLLGYIALWVPLIVGQLPRSVFLRLSGTTERLQNLILRTLLLEIPVSQFADPLRTYQSNFWNWNIYKLKKKFKVKCTLEETMKAQEGGVEV